jgi:hypothetical protein
VKFAKGVSYCDFIEFQLTGNKSTVSLLSTAVVLLGLPLHKLVIPSLTQDAFRYSFDSQITPKTRISIPRSIQILNLSTNCLEMHAILFVCGLFAQSAGFRIWFYLLFIFPTFGSSRRSASETFISFLIFCIAPVFAKFYLILVLSTPVIYHKSTSTLMNYAPCFCY